MNKRTPEKIHETGFLIKDAVQKNFIVYLNS